MRVLITGGCGFLGSQLGYYLYKKGHKIFLLDNLSYGHLDNLTINNQSFGTFIQDDIRSINFGKYLKDNNIEAVFHFAAIAPLPANQINPAEAYSVNVAGWANVLEACRLNKISKVILASTSAVYENNTESPFSETMQVSPTLTYSLTKKAAEDLSLSYAKLYKMDIVALRFFNVYGPHHDFRRKSPPVIAYIIKCLMTNQTPILHSNGTQERDYVYIDDVCSMCEKVLNTNSLYQNLLKSGNNHIFNVASNKSISLREIYEIIGRSMNSNIQPIYRDAQLLWDTYPALFEGYPIDEAAIIKEVNKFSLGSNIKGFFSLGWEPKIDMQEGLKQTVEYAMNKGL